MMYVRVNIQSHPYSNAVYVYMNEVTYTNMHAPTFGRGQGGLLERPAHNGPTNTDNPPKARFAGRKPNGSKYLYSTDIGTRART